MQDLPRGTVTFLFTDIKGSTRLWQEQAATMPAAYARHDTILRDAIGSYLDRVLPAEYDHAVHHVREVLGEEGFTASWVADRALSLEDAVAEALAVFSGNDVAVWRATDENPAAQVDKAGGPT